MGILLLLSINQSLITNNAFAAFKDDGWGARPLGMGGAYTAFGDDVNAQLYNPAGIWQVEDFEATFMYAKLFYGLDKVDLGMNYVSAVYPLKGKMNIGVLWADFVSADQYKEDTLAISAAMPITDYISVGTNLKYLNHAYTLDIRTVNDPVFASGNSKSAFAADLGIQYVMMDDKHYQAMMGFSAKNINQPDIGLKSEDIVPAELRLGFAATFYGKVTISPALDIGYRNQGYGTDTDKLNVYAGCETKFFNGLLAARAGANINEITVGIGFTPKIGNIETSMDYAFILPLTIQESSGSHRVSLTLHFLPPDAPLKPF
jgi:hypothetical protein